MGLLKKMKDKAEESARKVGKEGTKLGKKGFEETKKVAKKGVKETKKTVKKAKKKIEIYRQMLSELQNGAASFLFHPSDNHRQ